MAYNLTKILTAGLLAVVLILALIVDSDNADWAAPPLALLVGYVAGNTAVSGIAPIVEKDDR